MNGCGETALAIAERCGHELGAEVLRNARLKELKELRDQKLSKKNKKSKGLGGGAEGEGDADTAKEAQRAAEEAERRLLAEIASKEEAMEKQKALKAEAAAAKLLASEEGGAEQTATKSKRQKQKAKQKKKQAGLAQVDHDAMLAETAAVMAGFAEVEGQQEQEACSPEVEFVDGGDDDGHGARAAKGGDTSLDIDEPTAPITAPAAPVAPPHHRELFSPVVQPASTDEEPSARELTLICENNDLQSQLDATRRQLDELRRAHDAAMDSIKSERLDHSIERQAQDGQFAVLAKQNDALIKKCDEATSKAELERARARDIEAACDRAFGELKQQASELLRRQSSSSSGRHRRHRSSCVAGIAAGIADRGVLRLAWLHFGRQRRRRCWWRRRRR